MNSVSYLIDTDWVIDHLHGVRSVTQRLRELEPKGLAVSIISVAELWEGVLFSRAPHQSEQMLAEFLSGVAIIAIDEETCKRFGQVRGSLRQEGKTVGDFDLLIAAAALRHDLTLLSNNRKHFEAIKELRLESISSQPN